MTIDRFDEVLTTPFCDTEMDLHPDPMCIPTLATFKTLGGAKSFASDLRQFIEFVLSNDDCDPMSAEEIY